jgi:RNA polymerase sigma-70 factor (ECF subfamily)
LLKLAFYEGKSHSIIATEVGLPLGTVKSRLRLALARLRTYLGDDL